MVRNRQSPGGPIFPVELVNPMKPRTIPSQGPALARARELSAVVAAVALLLFSATAVQAQTCSQGTQRPLLRHVENGTACIHEIEVRGTNSLAKSVIVILGADQGTFLSNEATVAHFTISPSVPGLSVEKLTLGRNPDAPEGGDTSLQAATLELKLDGDITEDTTFQIKIDPTALSGSAQGKITKTQ